MKVPYLDLGTQYQGLKAEISAAIELVLNSNTYILGPAVSDFERQFAEFCQVKHAIGVNSGTSALHLALLAAGVGPGDEVIIPAMTFLATISAVDYTGATPVPVDIDPIYFCLDPAKLEAALTPRTKAIIPVHLYGHPADMDRIDAIAARHQVTVIEDAAQAHGTEYKGRRCGSLGRLAGFSFYPGKNLGAYGEGGAVTTNDDNLAEKVRLMRDWGSKERYKHVIKGFNYRMDGIQGAVLGVKLKYLCGWNEQRRKAAAIYRQFLRDAASIELPQEMPWARHVYHIFALRTASRNSLAAKLNNAGIATGIHYPTPIHLQDCFSYLGYRKGDFPVAEDLAATELSLPIFPEITPDQIEYVTANIKG